ncbi:ATP-binding cassette domain-containing protein [PVC group bacterium]|nr:ATP-binding cassette domain-containing protein [PVC group bacterium]
MKTKHQHIEVRNLTMAYGSFTLMRDVSFEVQQGSVMVIMGGSGCGKSTLLRHMLGLIEPAQGEILYNGNSFTNASRKERRIMLRKFGVLYQGGALWSDMTLAENIALPIREYTKLSDSKIADITKHKLSLVGLEGFEDFYPSDISGGMAKRAGLARAMALDPEILFFDEPSAGLDPISAKRLDDLILEMRDRLETTIVVVTHELASIFAIADRCVYLDNDTHTMLAQGTPDELLKNPPDPKIRTFLKRGEEGESGATCRLPARHNKKSKGARNHE